MATSWLWNSSDSVQCVMARWLVCVHIAVILLWFRQGHSKKQSLNLWANHCKNDVRHLRNFQHLRFLNEFCNFRDSAIVRVFKTFNTKIFRRFSESSKICRNFAGILKIRRFLGFSQNFWKILWEFVSIAVRDFCDFLRFSKISFGISTIFEDFQDFQFQNF